jgi:hypothetical protein
MVGPRGREGYSVMTAADFLPEIIEALDHAMQNIQFGRFNISFTVHEGRIVSIEKSFTKNIKRKVNEEKKANEIGHGR